MVVSIRTELPVSVDTDMPIEGENIFGPKVPKGEMEDWQQKSKQFKEWFSQGPKEDEPHLLSDDQQMLSWMWACETNIE